METTDPHGSKDSPKTKPAFFTLPKKIYVGVGLVPVFCCVVLFVMAALGWQLIEPWPYYALLLLCLIWAGILLAQLALHYMQRAFAKIMAMVTLALLFLIMIGGVFVYGLLFASMAYRQHYSYTSPQGKNRLVVIEGGFVDASFLAYPQKGPFYKKQENGFLSYHDFWGSAGGKQIKVNWTSENEAVVTIEHSNYRANEGSNPDERIVVVFGERL